jgi:hypothetical protein
MGNGHGDSGHEHWARLDDFLRTSPADPGCAGCRLGIDAYAELTVDDGAPAALLPGVAAHLESCADCREDLEGLIAALSHTSD